MMELEKLLESAAVARPGYVLASFKDAALPMYQLTARVITVEKKPLSPIEEGCLRALDAGLSTPAELCAFLGLPSTVLNSILAALNSRECLSYIRGVGEISAKVGLTVKGKASLNEAVQIVPQERLVKLVFDPLLGRVQFMQASGLWKPREVRDQGWLEIPLCGSKVPEVEDISLQELDRVMQRYKPREEQAIELLAFRRIERREMRFVPCVLLYYKAIQGKEVQVAFYREEGFSVEHENAFRDRGGPSLVGALHVRAAVAMPDMGRAGKLREEAKLLGSVSPAEERQDSESTESTAAFAGKTLRVVRCHEHPILLKTALSGSRRRFLVISPWIRDQVVDLAFLRSLEAMLQAKVSVYIGYGLAEETGQVAKDQARTKQIISKQAKQSLEELQRRYRNLVLKYLGNTHRKLLVSDQTFGVSTSFNWLSFKGDPKQKARDESGILVSKPEYVDEMFADGLDLITNGYDHPPAGVTTH
jgi:hypothetical protein